MKHLLSKLCILTVGISVLAGCCVSGSTGDRTYRKLVAEDFKERRNMLSHTTGIHIADDPSLTARERAALQFLYAYMPLSDAINYNGEYFLAAVRLSEQARAEMPWGESVPEDIYRHFVLPVRVNNENLDDARGVFFAELRDRVADMSMTDAVLEINHWCHEKVNYTPTDSRTSAPLSTVRTAAGRCGEESTFLVSALRSVGIPARQVYTPRWAHTDDNHAWVEAWVDGSWHFLGACEPEPVLDLGWFNAPASRAMLLHTNVFGRYNGPEDVMRATRLTTEINITENYAPVSPLTVIVTDTDGRTTDGALVEYKIYNYAEFYTVASKMSGADGSVTASFGHGDVMVWASKDGQYGFAKASVGKDDKITIRLEHQAGEAFSGKYSIVPPPEQCELPPVTDEQRNENTRRLAYEDSIRNAYIATFRTSAQASEWARKHNLDPERTAPLLVESKGNHVEVERFLESAAADGMGTRALNLLESVTRKDLHDTPASIFDDHLRNSADNNKRVLSPRVWIEILTPYRAYLQNAIPAELADSYRRNPQLLAEWCRDSLRMEPTQSNVLVPISPAGVWKSRIVDKRSRNLFFVAACRSLGIPAWCDPVTEKVRYSKDGTEYDVDFESPDAEATDYGHIKLNFTPSTDVPTPEYYQHFTISRIVDGRMRLLNVDDEATTKSLFNGGLRLESGDYVLVSGRRFDGGEVSAAMRIFSVEKDAVTEVELLIPESAWIEPKSKPASDIKFDTDVNYTDIGGNSQSLHDALASGCRVVGVIGAGQEPTNHLLQDIAKSRRSLEESDVPMLLLFVDEANAGLFKLSDYPMLPANLRFGTDSAGEVCKSLVAGAGLSRADLPVVVVTDESGRIYFVSSGYSIGLGERLVRELKK